MALDNERLRAELVVRLEELRASRERLVRAAESERHRIERDLHDGAQQQLVSIALSIALAEANLAKDPEVTASALDAARSGLTMAMGELRELSQGIRPAVLMERGLGAALGELSRRAGIPVRLELRLDAAVPAEIEAAAYFVAGEALANVAKHARATQVVMEAATVGSDLRLRIADDGIGGATARSGTGLRGLADRVEAFGGSLRVDSPAGQGTSLTVVLPCG
jgi:signal transduction histidine kinase